MSEENTYVIYYQFSKNTHLSGLKREVIKADNKENAEKWFRVMLQSRLESNESLKIVEIYQLIRF